MKFNYRKLKGRIVEIYGTHAAFAKAIGMSENSLSKKLTGKTQFKQGDIEKWCHLLQIPIEDAMLYFFN